MARLAAQIAEREQQYARRPRTHYIDAAGARSAVEAGYIEAWVNKVERVGNLNYPDAAVRRRLDGRLILNVLIDRAGEVVRVELAQSSGQRVLDDAAMRIVRDASPYSEFPVEMRKQYDQLMITRTWIFNSTGGGSFSSGR
jgi:protein TonB